MTRNKRIVIAIIAIIVIGVILTVASDTVLGTRFWKGEDDWMCKNGEWVKHGHPSAPMPTEPCGE